MSGTQSNQVVGVVDAVWKGVKLPLKKGATFAPGGLKNNAIVFGRQTVRSMEGVSSKLEGTFPFRKGDVLTDVIGDMSEGELQVVCDTGQTFVVVDAFLEEPPGFTGGEGERKATWMGSPAQEIS